MHANAASKIMNLITLAIFACIYLRLKNSQYKKINKFIKKYFEYFSKILIKFKSILSTRYSNLQIKPDLTNEKKS